MSTRVYTVDADKEHTPNYSSSPPSPQVKNVKKTISKSVHRLQKIEKKVKLQKLLNQALTTMVKYLRTQFQSL